MSKYRNGSEEDRIIREKEFKEKLYKVNPNLEITGKYINAQTLIEFKCNNCGEEHQYSYPQSLLKLMSKCARCDSERKLVIGLNDFATTHPQYTELFKNKEEAKTSTHGSSLKFDIVCPICEHEKKMKLADLTRHGFSCPKCGDKISYPNRFMTNLLSMLNVEYDSEKIFDWSQNRRYDFMLDNNLIEMDGGFHKGGTYRSYEDCKDIDDLKDRLVIKNGYNIIRIECYKSEFEHIKKNILNSELVAILKLDNFDWIKLEKELINNNLVKIASEEFNKYKSIKNITEIAESIGMTTAKLCSLLKTATRVGMTDYNPKLAKSGVYTVDKHNPNKRECICIETGKIYDSCKEAELEHDTGRDAVARVCRGERITVKNLHFDFLNTTEEIQDKKKSMEINKAKASHNMKQVICVETNQTYESASEASRILGMNERYISTLMLRNKKTKEGYTFRYV